ncbi:MAG: hypothetical protein JWM99_5051 [Verrucomicrobiales bacterium]|nr:hypothetical protein [Verrucomicrobiales bacterium]
MILTTLNKYFAVFVGLWIVTLGSALQVDAVTLSADQATPIGSGDTNKPGFSVRVSQIDVPGAKGLVGLIDRAEQQLAGIIATNSVDFSGTTNGVFISSGTINWNQEVGPGGSGLEIGNFTTVSDPSRPDQPIPGIPGIGPDTFANTDNIAAELITYVEFKTAGTYSMGINSDEGFKLTATDQPPTQTGALIVNGGSAAGSYYAVSGGSDTGGFSTPINGPIAGKLVYAQAAEGCAPFSNAAQIAGNVALIDRGTCTYTEKVQNALNAGAIAAIIVNNADPDSADGKYPIQMVGTPANLPAIMISKPDGAKLKTALATETVNVTLTAENEARLGDFNGERTSSDTIITLDVPQAGVYPFRLVWFEDTGAANLEWFTVQEDGTKILLNDRDNPAALKAFRARNGSPIQRPRLSILRNVNGSLTISWDHTGKVQSTAQLKISGTAWTDLPNGGTSPITVTATGSAQFYRLLSQ